MKERGGTGCDPFRLFSLGFLGNGKADPTSFRWPVFHLEWFLANVLS